MKLKTTVAIALLWCWSNANAGIEFWNSNLTWANQGQCSAEFTFDSGFEAIEGLAIDFDLVDEAGKVVASDAMRLEAFGGSSVDRYRQTFVEGEEICDSDLRMVVTKATATVNGKSVDLIRTDGIAVRDFKPLQIRIANP